MGKHGTVQEPGAPAEEGRITEATPQWNQQMKAPVDTAKVHDRRKLRFNRIEDLLAEIDRIAAADKAGNLRRSGNWTAGQTFGHLASWITYGYEGYPFPPPPWFIRWILRLKVKQYLKDGMPAGVRIPKVDEGTYATQELPTDAGADRLRQALRRLNSGEACRFESPAFGPMSHEDRMALNLRHAELHLGFLHPPQPSNARER